MKEGPRAVADWMTAQQRLLITDTTMRDGHQSLLATRMRSIDMIRIAPAYAANLPELFSVECWGGATFDVAYRFLQECPWQRLRDLRAQTGTSIILITHDMGAVAEMAERMIVMYAGRKAELGPVKQIIEHARHPYTQGLISCVPHLHDVLTEDRPERFEVPGIVPSLKDFGRDECLFASRCAHFTDQCRRARPPAKSFDQGQIADCWHAEEL